jgi:hypothetical protein
MKLKQKFNVFEACFLVIILLKPLLAFGFRKARPVLLISFDGLRDISFDEFLLENPNSNFKKFMDAGVRAEWMKVTQYLERF